MVIIASDIGSTTTKLVAFRLEGNELLSLGAVQEPTTVESPFSDVSIGLFRAFRKLEGETGLQILRDDAIQAPYFTTSSAGGGLQVMVVGYTLADSCRITQATAYAAGAVISGAFAIDSEKNRIQLIDKMSRPNPDLVLMSGGTEGGALSGVVTMAYMLNHAKPVAKYGSGKLPLLYCGNSHARKYVEEALDHYFQITVTENVIPGNHKINLTPAIEAVQGLFMEHVMQKAPGYPKVTELVSAPVKPTPIGVSHILKDFSEKEKCDLVLVDMGGATTDIFSSMGGEMRRTVAANIGMSYSMSNTLAEAGIHAVMQHIQGAFEEDVRRWAYGKSLFPVTIPRCEEAELIETAIAAEGLKLAWENHLQTGYNHGRPNWRNILRMRRTSSNNPDMETLSGKRCRFDSVKILIGAGGIFSHSSPIRAAWMLAESFRPPGVTKLYIDTHFQSPHMGALLENYPEEALDYYSNHCLQPVCRVLSPAWSVTGAFARIQTPEGIETVWTGGWRWLPDTSGCSVTVFGPDIPGVSELCDGLPLLIDCRRNNNPLPMDFERNFSLNTSGVNPPFQNASPPAVEEFSFSLSLPFNGSILVKKDQHVKPGECLGRITEIPPRHFVLDIKNSRSCPPEASTEKIMSAIQVKPGDTVKTGDRIFHLVLGKTLYTRESPVDGSVTRVIPPGVVMLEEDMSHDSGKHVVKAAKKMGVPPSKMKNYMNVDVGDFVYRNQLICNDPPVSMCPAPCPGFITEIDYRKGTVTIQYSMMPIKIESPLNGKVSSTDGRRTVTVSSRSLRITGVLGFGGTVRGRLTEKEDNIRRGDIFFTRNCITLDQLTKASKMEAAGAVAPSISGRDLVSWLGREPGLFITGAEELPLSLLLLQGIGESRLPDEKWKNVPELTGNTAALFPVTKVRAGTVRPFLSIAPEQET